MSEEQQKTLRYAAESCVTASRGLSRIIEASDRGLAGLMDKMEVTALTADQRASMAAAAQPAFETHVAENLDPKANELLGLFKTEVQKANDSVYMD